LGVASTVIGGVGLARALASRFDPVAGAALVEPLALRSGGGLLRVRLEVAEGPVRIGGRNATALSYNGGLPGPTLHLLPGDRLRVQLVNRLGAPTNVHVHGLHVSPLGNGDNMFVSVDPGRSFDYDYQLPEDHPAGVYWYHPHHHGMVAEQIFGGLYGAIIVGDPPNASSLVPVSRERVLVISDISLDGAGHVRPTSTMARMMGREGDLVLVNGQARPVLVAQPGQRERWRIVNACAARYLRLSLDGQQLQLLGIDSGRFTAPRDVTEVVLVPGNRADLLVTAGRGTSSLQALPYNRGEMMGMMGGASSGGGGMPGMGIGQSMPSTNDGADGIVLASLVVNGLAVPALAAVPAQPEPRDLRGAVIAGQRQLTLAMGMGMGMGMGLGMVSGGMSFTIDGKEFDPDRVDQAVRAGIIEEWMITNTSPMDHPLHLHVWPMQLIEQNGQQIADATWQDVVNVPAHSNVKVRVAFETFSGRTLYHCHILDHEDNGMMGVITAS